MRENGSSGTKTETWSYVGHPLEQGDSTPRPVAPPPPTVGRPGPQPDRTGRQAGAPAYPRERVSCVTPEPSGRTTNMSGASDRYRSNAIHAPSGDHRGVN